VSDVMRLAINANPVRKGRKGRKDAFPDVEPKFFFASFASFAPFADLMLYTRHLIVASSDKTMT
jgi:hypothetical protein